MCGLPTFIHQYITAAWLVDAVRIVDAIRQHRTADDDDDTMYRRI